MGWGASVTQDLARCRLAARMMALFYELVEHLRSLVEPDRHMEAITSRHCSGMPSPRGAACRDKQRSP